MIKLNAHVVNLEEMLIADSKNITLFILCLFFQPLLRSLVLW